MKSQKLIARDKTRLTVFTDPVTGEAELKQVRWPTRIRLGFPKHPSGEIDSKALFDEIRNGLPSSPSGAERMENPYCIWWDRFGPHSCFGSFFILQDHQSTPKERARAAERLAWIIQGRSKDVWADEAIRRFGRKKTEVIRRSREKVEERQLHAEEAILLGNMSTNSKDGWPLRYEKLLQESRRFFEEMAVEEVFGHPLKELKTRDAGRGKERKPPQRDLETDVEKAAIPDHDPETLALEALIASEAAKLAPTKLLAIQKRVTKKQNKLLQNALYFLQRDDDLDGKQALQKAADQIKMSPTHKGKTLHSIRHKAK